jgi:hypothetical protein
MLASELARHLSVSPSTITNWATKHRPHLAFVLDRGRRRFSLDDYDRFAAAHSKLRGIVKQAMDTKNGPPNSAETAAELSLLEVRGRLQKFLEQIDAVHDGSVQTKKSAVKLRREVAAALKLFPAMSKAEITKSD